MISRLADVWLADEGVHARQHLERQVLVVAYQGLDAVQLGVVRVLPPNSLESTRAHAVPF